MKFKSSYLLMLPLVAIGAVGVAELNTEAPYKSLVIESTDTLRVNNICASPFDMDYMQLLEADDEVFTSGCGGLL